jgi:hypothetical protein
MSTFNFSKYLLLVSVIILFSSCEKYSDDLSVLTRPKNGDVFLDGFTAGMNYAAFGGSVVTAFQVDNDVTYNKSNSSMRIDVPEVNDARGSYAGGAYFLTSGRDLSGYNVLTFWAKATKSAKINEVGFGNDLVANTYSTTLYNVPITTVWQKYYIPIPDPSKLTNEKGMFYFAEGHEDSAGYSFWIDEVKFEKLGTIVRGESMILNGSNTANNSAKGVETQITGLFTNFSLPDGTNLKMPTPASYFTFESSNPAIANVNAKGKVNSLNLGYSVITASLAGQKAKGSMVVNITGFINAPTPSYPSNSVVSLFSDNYTNRLVDYYNGYWQPFQKTVSADFKVGTDNILNYTDFNFVGISFANPTLDATNFSTLSMDIFVPSATLNPGVQFKVTVRDFGANGADGGGDDTDKVVTFSNTSIAAGQWKTLKIPLDITKKSKLGLIILSDSDLGNFKNFYLDNIFFHN